MHIMAAYDHYRYRAAQIDSKGLLRTDDWMAPKLADSAEELRVWGVHSRLLKGFDHRPLTGCQPELRQRVVSAFLPDVESWAVELELPSVARVFA